MLGWQGIRRRLGAVLRLDDPPWKIALGLAVGVFISCTPFYGLQTLMAVLAAVGLRLNKLATVTGAWLNLPWFAPFVYGFSLKVGEYILSGGRGVEALGGRGMRELAGLISPHLSWRQLTEWFLYSSDLLLDALKPLFVGTTVVGIVAGLVTYVVALVAVREIRGGARRGAGERQT
jgi:uncharacterized protein (DUF2062 family)